MTPEADPPSATAAPVPDFRIDLARTVSGLEVSGVVPPDLRAALEEVFGAEALGPDLRAADGVVAPEPPDFARIARIVQDWSTFALTAGPDGARLEGEPASAADYFDALAAAGGALELDLSFLTRTLPRADVLALIDHLDPCGTIVPLDLGADLSPTDQLTLFGQVGSVQQGIDLRRDLILLLPGTLDGDGLHATSPAMCDVARAFDDLAEGSPDLSDAIQVTMDGAPAALGVPVSHGATPQFALRRDALPPTGHLWTGLVMRGPGRSLLMLPLSQPSGDVEDLGRLSREPGAPEYVALSLSEAEPPELDLTFAPELALTFDPDDTYATLLGFVLDREVSGLPTLGETSAPDAADYLGQLRETLEREGVRIQSHFQRTIAIE